MAGRPKPGGKPGLLDVHGIGLRVEKVLRHYERAAHGGARLFCKETGYGDESFLSLARRGQIGPDTSADKLIALAGALGVLVGWLIAGEGGEEIQWVRSRTVTPTPQPKSSVVPRSRP
jgi:hypothetical protein